MQRHIRGISVVVFLVAVLLVAMAIAGITGITRNSVVSAAAPSNFVLLSPSQDISTAVYLIDHSHGQVDLEMYELGNPEIIAALESVTRGGNVRVILDPTERQSKIAGPELVAHGIHVHWMAIPGGIDHVKLLIADGHVLSGGVNMGTGSAYTEDVAAEVTDVSAAESIFNSDWVRSGLHELPIAKSAGIFVTGHGAILDTILHVLNSASSTIAPTLAPIPVPAGTCYVVANYLSDYTIRNALVGAVGNGLHVYVLLNVEAYGSHRAAEQLSSAGAGVRFAPKSPYLHAKVLACQSQAGYGAVVGSANFSYDGMDVNHELDISLGGNDAMEVFKWARSVYANDK